MIQQHLRDLPSEALDRLEMAVRAFEDAWQQGKRPVIDAALPESGPERRAVLIELIHVDLECRLRAGQPVRVEHYLKKYPDLKTDSALVVDLLAKEMRFRRAREPDLAMEDYIRRFPALKKELHARLETETETLAESVAPPQPAGPAPTAPAACTVAELLHQLTAAALLSDEQRRELSDLANSHADAASLATELVRRGWLTAHQRSVLLQRRGAALVIGPYVVLDRLGEGGMGQVFKARHQVMKRLVAVKVIRKGVLAYGEQVQRFYREIEAVARLSHPNIVLAHDAGRVGDVHFFAMEYVEGTDLARMLREHGPVPVDKACGYIRQAALGLQHAHERGLVHRDIKPSNLLLCSGENGVEVVKILDLGLARIHEANTKRLTQVGEVMGTADYIAPEQATDASQVDIRADIYSLGCTLYHLIAGQPVFVGGSMVEKLRRHQKESPRPLGKIRPLPAGLDEVIARMMAKRPKDRYQTPREVVEALAPFCTVVAEPRPLPHPPPSHAPVATTAPVSVPAPSGAAILNGRRRLLGSALVLVLFLVGLGAWLWTRPAAAVKQFTNSVGMKLVWIPPGKFMMGAPESEPGRVAGHEGQYHETTIGDGFYLGVHEVTQEQYEKVMGANPSKFNNDNGGGHTHPVEQVTWSQANDFCLRLGQLPQEKEAKRRYRLPTEAEWEYACRAGTTAAFSFGDDRQLLEDHAWWQGNSAGKTHPVGQRKPNPWGLFDMHGNVGEWVQISKKGEYIVRGGSHIEPWSNLRSAFRGHGSEVYSGAHVGLRVVCEVNIEAKAIATDEPMSLHAFVGQLARLRGVKSWTLRPRAIAASTPLS